MNKLRLTSLGRQAANNASAGGIRIRPVYVKVGDSGAPFSNTQDDIQGNLVFQGDIYFVEVLNEESTRFVFYIPPHVPPMGGVEIREAALYLDDNVMFARCVFDESYTLQYNEGTRVNAILTTAECDLSVIDVTIGDYSSIPATPYVRQLPSPVLSDHNVISVLDLHSNPDGSSSPGIALRYGQGNFQWGFSGHDRLFTGNPDAGATGNMFSRTSITDNDEFVDGDRVIVHVAAGVGAGETRRFAYNQSNDNFVEIDANPFAALDSSSTISIWKRMVGGGGCCGCGSSSDSGDPTTVPNYISAKPMFNVGKWGVDTEAELETLLSSASELMTTSNQSFAINVIDDSTTGSGSTSTVNLYPLYGTSAYGLDSTAEVETWASTATEISNTNNGAFSVSTGSTDQYGYFLVPEQLGDLIFIDQSTSLPGGWDGAGWPPEGIYDNSINGPINITRNIEGQATNWKLYRMDFPGVGDKTYDYTVANEGVNVTVTGSGTATPTPATNYGYFVYPVDLGLATFTDQSINIDGGWDGADWAEGDVAGSTVGPITITRNIGDGPSDWYVYRTDQAGIGNRIFDVTFQNAGVEVNLPDGTTIVPGSGEGESSGNCCCGDQLPNRTSVPEDWVLTRGSGDSVVWAPQKGGTEVVSTLYTSPGKLRVTVVSAVGDGSTNRYNLGGVVLKDNNYVVSALGGIYQNRTAFDIQGSELEFAENIPPNVPIDLRMFTKEPGNGTYTDFVTDDFIGDGLTTRFKLSHPIDGAEYVFNHIQSVLQQTVAYSYDAATQEIVFTQAPEPGLNIEMTSMIRRQEEGYSTEMLTQQLITVGDTLFIELPITPQSKDMTFVNVNGSHIHRSLYSIVDNKVILSSAIPGGRDVEVLIFNNVLSQGSPNTNLTGIVTDAVLTSKSLKLIRHGAEHVSLPIPSIELNSGRGIKITGNHPTYKVESTVAEAFSETTNFKFSTLQKQVNSDEIIYSYRVNVTGDVLLTVTADFSAELGPGFISPDGLERMEYVIGFRTTKANEPDYGRQIKGTGTAGFSALDGGNDTRAYANASLTQVLELIKNNVPAGYVDVVVKMRIKNAETSKYESLLSVNFNVIGTPKIVKTSGQ